MSAPRIGLVHAVAPAMAPIHSAFARLWPQARYTNVLDDGLPADLEAEGGLTPRIFGRVRRLAELAADGADAVLFTCTAFDEAVRAAAAYSSTPLVLPNQAMFDAALALGSRIGLIGTFEPAMPVMQAALHAHAMQTGRPLQLHALCVPGAMAAARMGNVRLHNKTVAGAVSRLPPCDAILLAQFSTSTALADTQARTTVPVLSAPDAAVLALKAKLTRPAQQDAPA